MRTCRLYFLTGILLLAFTAGGYAQEQNNQIYLPKFAIKTNALYLATTTFNLGFEVSLSRKMSLDVSGNYNPWEFGNNKQIKHWLVQPELRYWLCERFNGHFFGIHGHYAEYNVSNLNIFGMGNYRYEGNLYGGGISYGYQWLISKRWSMEAEIGVGYARLKYDKHECGHCGQKLGNYSKNYWGPTKVALNMIYVIK